MNDKDLNLNLCNGAGFILSVVFMVLKLCGVIAWSWFWVLSPLIFGTALNLLVICIVLLILAIANN